MRGVLAVLLLLPLGCSYTFDDSKTDVKLVGEAPALSSFEKINKSPAHGYQMVLGAAQDYWIAFHEPDQRVRVVELAAPKAEELLMADKIYIEWRAFYLLNQDDKLVRPTVLTVHSAGEDDSRGSETYELPPGPEFLLVDSGGAEDEFLYWAVSKKTTTFQLQRRHGVARTLPLPAGILGDDPGSAGFSFASGGKLLFARDAKQHLHLQSTEDDSFSKDLGLVPALYVYLESRDRLLTVGDQGVALQPVRSTTARSTVLDAEPADPNLLWFNNRDAYYIVGEGMRRVALDGKSAPVLVQAGALRLLATVGPKNSLAYTKDSYTRYTNSVGDGWVGDWRFMERGHWVTYSASEQRVRFLEHAAQNGGIGELLSTTLPTDADPSPTPLHLALNVRQYDDLGKGHILAVENHAFTGTQSRLVVIDEHTHEARWVCPSAHEYAFIPGTNDLLVDVVTGATGFDLLRVPLPQ